MWTAAVAATEAIPYLLFGLLAGAFADRLPRLPVMPRADLLSAIILISVPVAYLVDALHPINILVAGSGVSDSIRLL